MLSWLLALACIVASLVGTKLWQRHALRSGLIDVPNARSSHAVPTPRSGGAAIFMAFMVAMSVLFFAGDLDARLFVSLLGGGTAVALIGYLDDRKQLSARLRVLVHFAAALWGTVWMGGFPAVTFGGSPIEFGWLGYILGTLAIVWTINLFNFMDGIDGLAGSEAVFVAWSGALLGALSGVSDSVVAAAMILGASCCGFLILNWPPARIFMGDVGSGFIGYSIAVLALAAGHSSAVAPIVWWILGGFFFMDATLTLIGRLARRERVYEAHRNHAYQWLARHWNSHQKATVAIALVNLLWLFPCAALATFYSGWAGALTLVALLPMAVVIIVLDAGRRETRGTTPKT